MTQHSGKPASNASGGSAKRAKKKLGRGLDALLSESSSESVASLVGAVHGGGGGGKVSGDLKNLPVDLIQRGKYQPRREMDQEALEELAQSIRGHGVMQPIVVRPVSAGKYEIIAGERRWRASQLAGLGDIPCIIKRVDDEAMIAMSLIENIQRENLNPIEEAVALKRLQEEFQLTQQQVADAVGKSRPSVSNLMRLMSLNPEVRRMLEQGKLEAGHAKVLLGLSGARQKQAAKEVLRRGLSVRQTEPLVRRMLEESKSSGGGKGSKSGKASRGRRHPDIKRLEDRLGNHLGAKVSIQHNARGRGKLIITYNSPDELDGILAHIR